MDNKEIYKVLIVSIKEFGSEVEVIRQICQKYEVAEIFDDKNNVAWFNFYDSKSWKTAKEQIQLIVGSIILKTSSKYVNIEKQMKSPIEPPQPPAWFLEFQKLIFARFDKQDEFNERQEKFNSYVVSRLDKIEADIKKMDTTQPIWFTQWVESDFDPLKHRIDNIVRLNNLKE